MPRRRLSARPEIATVSSRLLDWYDRARRDLPWRYAPGKTADPYRVWLSEIMLQQTTVKAVVPYFNDFTTRWPTVTDLADAALDDVLKAWAGLGYYARARNLHACAAMVRDTHGGAFPADEAALRALPGIGPYTAAAVAAIGFGLKATPVDGNIERVVARLFAIETPLPAGKPEIETEAATLTPDRRAGDFAQAMMDLGATICTPQKPSCLLCPLRAGCHAADRGIAAELPRKAPRPERPTRYGTAFVVIRGDGAVLLRRRPAKGLLGGMMEVPSTEWSATRPDANAVRATEPVAAEFKAAEATVVHVFTHFRLELVVMTAKAATSKIATVAEPDRCQWVTRANLEDEALPSVIRKVLAAAGVLDVARPPL